MVTSTYRSRSLPVLAINSVSDVVVVATAVFFEALKDVGVVVLAAADVSVVLMVKSTQTVLFYFMCFYPHLKYFFFRDL